MARGISLHIGSGARSSQATVFRSARAHRKWNTVSGSGIVCDKGRSPRRADKPVRATDVTDVQTGLADQGPTHDRLVLRRVLSEDQETGSSIQAPAMEDRTPFEPEVRGRIHA